MTPPLVSCWTLRTNWALICLSTASENNYDAPLNDTKSCVQGSRPDYQGQRRTGVGQWGHVASDPEGLRDLDWVSQVDASRVTYGKAMYMHAGLLELEVVAASRFAGY